MYLILQKTWYGKHKKQKEDTIILDKYKLPLLLVKYSRNVLFDITYSGPRMVERFSWMDKGECFTYLMEAMCYGA